MDTGLIAVPKKSSKDLNDAIYDDFKRSAIDAAKKRAVAQHVDYDTFKDMVSVAHLRPLQAPNTHAQDGLLVPAWRFGPDGQPLKSEADAAEAAAILACPPPTDPPATALEFETAWRRGCPGPGERYRYLRGLDPSTLGVLFKAEVPLPLLADILTVLADQWLAAAGAAEGDDRVGGGGALREATAVAVLLRALAGAGRFALTRLLLGAVAKAAAAKVLGQLEVAALAAEAGPARGGGGVRSPADGGRCRRRARPVRRLNRPD